MERPDATGTVRELHAIERRLAAAWQAGDCDGWAQHLAPDWRVTHVNGEVITREQAIAMCRTPQVAIADMRYDDLEVRVFGDAAVVTGRTTATAAAPRADTFVLRFTDVFIRREGTWKVVASHATSVADPVPGGA